MNIYLVSQGVNGGYDTYKEFVCVAFDEEQARNMDPAANGLPMAWNCECACLDITDFNTHWANRPADVKVRRIGKADTYYTEPAVLTFNYRAG